MSFLRVFLFSQLGVVKTLATSSKADMRLLLKGIIVLIQSTLILVESYGSEVVIVLTTSTLYTRHMSNGTSYSSISIHILRITSRSIIFDLLANSLKVIQKIIFITSSFKSPIMIVIIIIMELKDVTIADSLALISCGS